MQNPFKIFDIPESLELDTTQLKTRYLDLQRQFHPDNFAQDPVLERQTLQQSALINDAWQILQNPISRAGFLLSQIIGTEELERSSSDSEFLSQQMAQRETLAEIEHSQNFEGLELFSHKAQSTQQNLWQEFKICMQNQDYIKAKVYFHRLQYGQKLLQEIARIEDKISDF